MNILNPLSILYSLATFVLQVTVMPFLEYALFLIGVTLSVTWNLAKKVYLNGGNLN